MTLEEIAALAQIVGVLVVAATLIYLTIQVRQGAEQLRSEARQTQLENDQTGVYKLVEFPALGRIMSQVETPTLEEKTQLVFWIIGQMRAREYEWLQYQSGAMTRESWETYSGVIYFVLGTARGRAAWALCQDYFNPKFVGKVSEMTAGIPEIDFWDRLKTLN